MARKPIGNKAAAEPEVVYYPADFRPPDKFEIPFKPGQKIQAEGTWWIVVTFFPRNAYLRYTDPEGVQHVYACGGREDVILALPCGPKESEQTAKWAAEQSSQKGVVMLPLRALTSKTRVRPEHFFTEPRLTEEAPQTGTLIEEETGVPANA